MIKQLLIVVVVILGIIAIRATTRPDNFRVERSITIAASPQRVFPLINDFHNFGRWSPWEKLDPAMQRSITGPASGPGAVYEWSGNSKAGAGRMQIMEATPFTRVLTKLTFLKPITSENMAEYTLVPNGDSTKVTWAMYGRSPFISKVMQVFISMDDMIGGDFSDGLAALKRVAEQS
jgi:hypothetical protein